jgi:hypothetical protein
MSSPEISDPKQIQAAWKAMAGRVNADPAARTAFFDNPVKALKSAGLPDQTIIDILCEECGDAEAVQGYVMKYIESEDAAEVSGYAVNLGRLSVQAGQPIGNLALGAGICVCTSCCVTHCAITCGSTWLR